MLHYSLLVSAYGWYKFDEGACCKSISNELFEIFNFALVWGRSTKVRGSALCPLHTVIFLYCYRVTVYATTHPLIVIVVFVSIMELILLQYNPQRVGISHVLVDEDVIQIIPKTVVQQKASKDYQQRVSWFAYHHHYSMTESYYLILKWNVKVDAHFAKVSKDRKRLRKIKEGMGGVRSKLVS
jgi:hypothetical protein